MNWNNLDWDNFSCVDMARKIKDEMSAKLNAMTPQERHLYFEHINAKHCGIIEKELHDK